LDIRVMVMMVVSMSMVVVVTMLMIVNLFLTVGMRMIVAVIVMMGHKASFGSYDAPHSIASVRVSIFFHQSNDITHTEDFLYNPPADSTQA
jgi:hypothetical protein